MASIRGLKKKIKKSNSQEEKEKLIDTLKEIERSSKLEKNASRIIPIKLQEEEGEKYFHYCSFHHHPGIIGEQIVKDRYCLNGCMYYKRFAEK